MIFNHRNILFIVLILLLVIGNKVYAEKPPSFLILTYGFWGSLDRLPLKDSSWLEQSPYPHICKRQPASFLSGSEYQPIPQSMLATGEGPSVTKYFFCSYYLLEHELAYWAKKINSREHRQKIKIFDNWQVLQADNIRQQLGDINVIYLKYDWRLDLPQTERDYARPLIFFIKRNWPEAKINWVGHSLGGLVGRYVAAAHPGVLNSLISIGGPNYGIYELGMQCRGERVDYDGRWDLEKSQEFGLRVAEQFFFGTKTIKSGDDFLSTAANFIKEYLPMMKWLDPQAGLLSDGFGTLTKLDQAVPHTIAIYGLGFGSYDLHGNYHPAISEQYGVGPGLEPNHNSPPEYAITGDGRVDPVSAVGPFTNTLCIGMDKSHGSMMWSPLVLTFLIDLYYFNGKMSPKDLWLEMRRLDIPYIERKKRIQWVLNARKIWDNKNNTQTGSKK